MYFIIAAILFFACFAMMVAEGIWNNLLSLMTIVIAGVTAFGIYQPITIWADESTGGSYTYLLDLLIIWGLFAAIAGILKMVAQFLSKYKVAFPPAVDRFGGAGVGLVAAYLLCGFAMATLHMAPLTHDAFSGKFIYGNSVKEVRQEMANTSKITTPDMGWLSLTSTLLSSNRWGGGGAVFSAPLYVHTYAKHRKVFESIEKSIVKR